MWLLILVQPLTGYMNSEPSSSISVALYQDIWKQIPIVSFLEETQEYVYATQSAQPYSGEELIRMMQEENMVEQETEEEAESLATEQEERMQETIVQNEEIADDREEENTEAENKNEESNVNEASGNDVIYIDEAGFQPAKEKSVVYTKEQLSDIEFIKSNFYTEDATTKIKESQLTYDKLLGFDGALKQDNSQPQILIYHTHSQETYIDSDPTRAETTIMGVGEYLTRILRDQYGFHVIHHLGQYDVKSRDYAYTEAAKGVEAVLAQYPSIEVVIDLHRDAVPENTKLVTTIQGKEVAKFMFFNGLSYTRELGELTSLPNPYVQDNLSFAFQMNLAAQEYYPGITRKIYLKGYRYNMHYRAKSLLVELGAQTNTVEEAMNACEPLAHIIAMVLKGETE